MPFVAEASRVLPVAPEIAFDKLADFSSWSEWMPRSFRPASKQSRALRKGDRLRVRISGAPVAASIEVTVAERAREITWCGGPRALLRAEHRFLFEPHEDGTRVRSVETWRGALAPLLRFVVKPSAERIGREQLEGLARAVS
jgi:hypothetical protein